MTLQLLRFKDLRERGIVDNRPTLQRGIALEDFPPGRLLGPNTRAWTEQEIGEWIESRPTKAAERPPSTLLRNAAGGSERASLTAEGRTP